MDNTYIESLFDFTLEENVDFATFAFKRLIITEEILAYYKLAKPLIHLYNNSKKSPITKIISDDFFIETYNTLKLISKDKYSYNKFLLLFWTMINYNEYNTLNLETNELIINFNYVPEPGNLINLYLHASSFFNKIISNLTLKSGELSTYTYESLVYDFFNTSDVKTFYSKVFKSKLFYNRIDIWETFSLKFPIITKKRTFHLEETSHNLFNSMVLTEYNSIVPKLSSRKPSKGFWLNDISISEYFYNHLLSSYDSGDYTCRDFSLKSSLECNFYNS